VLPAAVASAVRDYRRALEEEFGARLLDVKVFGSMARGEGGEDSDIDVFVLIDRLTFVERRRALDLGGEIGLHSALPIAPAVFSSSEWAELIARERRLPREVDRDGVSV
jgi:predicted nucleotidyltransferase